MIMTLEVEQFTEDNRQEWDDFVNAHPEGRYSHLSGFKDAIEATFDYEPSYWLFRRNGRLAAIFPSFVKRSWLLGNKLISQPFCEYGGLLGNNLNEEDHRIIRQKLNELLIEHNVPYLEVHGGMGITQDAQRAIFVEKPMQQYYATLPLTTTEEIWKKIDPKSGRWAIRKAERSGLECTLETTEKNISKEFYPSGGIRYMDTCENGRKTSRTAYDKEGNLKSLEELT